MSVVDEATSMDRASCEAEHGMDWAREAQTSKGKRVSNQRKKKKLKKKGKWLLQMVSRAWSGTRNHYRFDEF